MPGFPFDAPNVNWGLLSQIPDQFAAGQQWRESRDLDAARKKALAGPFDPQTALNRLLEIGDLEGAAKISQLGRGQAEDTGIFGTPIYGQDEAGNTVLGVIAKDGSFRRLETGGVTPTPGVQFLDQGTQHLPVDKRTGMPVGAPIPIDIAGETAAKTVGEATGAAQVSMPQVENATRRILSTIEDIERSPGLSRATGPISARLPTVTGEVADVEAKVAQAVGGGFLQMFNELRGAGQITEAEGRKASDALFRVGQLSQSDEGYLKALQDAKFEVFELLNVVRRKAGMEPQRNPYAAQEVRPAAQFDGGQEVLPGAQFDGGWTDLGNGVRIRQK